MRVRKPVKIFAFVGPSAVGKSTLAWRLLDRFRGTLEIVLSYTTRDLRDTDRKGEYEKLHQVIFDMLVEKGTFFAWNVGVHDKQYGTSLASLKLAIRGNKRGMIIVTPEAAEILYRLYPDQVMFFFIWPPERRVLQRRLVERGDSAESVERRIADCKDWASQSLNSPVPYIYLKNDGPIEKTLAVVESYFI